MESFTPISALVGGAMIGAAAVMLMLFSGRIAGIAGIIGGVFGSNRREAAWRLAFILGLIASPYAVWLGGESLPSIEVDASLPVVLAGGVLVGFGTRLGNGCTSGHGVCGLARFSGRSAVATLVFMVVAAGVVYVVRHGAG